MSDKISYTQRLADERGQNPVMEELRRLKNKPCLGMHVWEGMRVGEVPHNVLNMLNMDDAEIEAQRASDQPALLSLSLVPSTGDKPCAVRPHSVHCYNRGHIDDLGKAGYLFDLDQDVADRPILPLIYEGNLGSENKARPKVKDFRLDDKEKQSRVKAIANAKQGSEAQMVQQARGPEGAAITKQQLEGLDGYMHQQAQGTGPFGPRANTIEHSEILASLKRHHLKAIFVPSFPGELKPEIRERYVAGVLLTGAIAGLQHEEAGYSLPVVVYHVTGAQQGEFSYIGQGRQQLLAVAQRAWDMVKSNPEDYPRFYSLNTALRKFVELQQPADRIPGMIEHLAKRGVQLGGGYDR